MAQRSSVGSPCIGVCELDAETGYCRGCLRTVDEIMAWPTASDSAKRAVLRQLKPRRAMLPPERRAARG